MKKITQIVMAVSILVWIVWDIVVATNRTPGDTESEIIRGFASQHLTVPWAVGVLMGHFFWNVKQGVPRWRTLVVMPLITLAIVAVDVWGNLPYVLPVIPFLVGVGAGRLLWPQHVKSS